MFTGNKKESFDLAFIRNIWPPEFDSFEFLPSIGALGGILVAWKSRAFSGQLAFSNSFAISIEFSSTFNNENWLLTSIYAPCTSAGKRAFLEWFREIQMPPEVDWLIVGDFNLIRRAFDRNREGADATEMFLFNEAISKLDFIELPLHGRQYTWSNKQFPPLLERLDWFFTSSSWTAKFPNSLIKTLVMETLDHWPCVLEIGTKIPQSSIFRFENHWLNHEGFIDVAVRGWSAPASIIDPAKILTAKFKNMRRELRSWKKTFPKLAIAIENVKLVLYFLEAIELFRDLSLPEWNFRNLVADKLIYLLKQQRIYWKQRGKIRWVKEGDAGTKYFHAHATIRNRKNTISILKDKEGNSCQEHDHKAKIILEAFKNRMGKTEFNHMFFNLNDLLQQTEGLEQLEMPFS